MTVLRKAKHFIGKTVNKASSANHSLHLTSTPSLQQKMQQVWHLACNFLFYSHSSSQSKTEAHLLSLDYTRIYLITYGIMKTSLKNSAKNCNTSDIIFSSRISHIPIACENNLYKICWHMNKLPRYWPNSMVLTIL